VPDVTAARLVRASALAVGVLFVVSLALVPWSDQPGFGDPGNDVLSYAGEHRTALLISAYLGSAAWLLAFPVFLGTLREWLRTRPQAEAQPHAALAGAGFAGGILEAATIAVVYLISIVLAHGAGRGVGADGARSLNDAFYLSNGATGLATVACLVPFSVLILRSGVLPRAAGWIGLAGALSHALSAASLAHSGLFAPDGLFGFTSPALMTIWVVYVGIAAARATAPLPAAARRPA
jgi:hypothetical protein